MVEGERSSIITLFVNYCNTEFGRIETKSMATEDYSKFEDRELEVQYLEQKLKCLKIETELTKRKLIKTSERENRSSSISGVSSGDCPTPHSHHSKHLSTELESLANCPDNYCSTGKRDNNGNDIFRGDFVHILTPSKGKTNKFRGVVVAIVVGVEEKERGHILVASTKDKARNSTRSPENLVVVAKNLEHYLQRINRKEIPDWSESTN